MTTARAPRYFVVSPHKTGTTSIEAALVELGAGRRPMRYDGSILNEFRPLIAAHRSIARKARSPMDYLRDHGETVRTELAPMIEAAGGKDIFADAPLGHGHVHTLTIKAMFPEARFIWCQRPFKQWIASVEAWETARPAIYPKAHLWETSAAAQIEKKRNMRRARMQAFKKAEKAWPEDCIRIDIGSSTAMAELAAFCGVADPGTPLPHVNVGR